jgi:hypothetical protein
VCNRTQFPQDDRPQHAPILVLGGDQPQTRLDHRPTCVSVEPHQRLRWSVGDLILERLLD